MFLQHSFYNKRLDSVKKKTNINIRLTVITEVDLHQTAAILSYPKFPFF